MCFFFQAEDGIRDADVTGVQTCALPIFATHWLLRESGVWRDRETEEVREAQRHADYAYRLAVEPAPAKETRLFGLADWIVERFRSTIQSASPNSRVSLAGDRKSTPLHSPHLPPS